MRLIIDAFALGTKVVALSNDGRLYLSGSPPRTGWSPIGELPQEGFDESNTLASTAVKSRGAGLKEAIPQMLAALGAELSRMGIPSPFPSGMAVDPNCPVHGVQHPTCGAQTGFSAAGQPILCGEPAAFMDLAGGNARCVRHAVEAGDPLDVDCPIHRGEEGKGCFPAERPDDWTGPVGPDDTGEPRCTPPCERKLGHPGACYWDGWMHAEFKPLSPPMAPIADGMPLPPCINASLGCKLSRNHEGDCDTGKSTLGLKGGSADGGNI